MASSESRGYRRRRLRRQLTIVLITPTQFRTAQCRQDEEVGRWCQPDTADSADVSPVSRKRRASASPTAASSSTLPSNEDELDRCAICLMGLRDRTAAGACGHEFCVSLRLCLVAVAAADKIVHLHRRLGEPGAPVSAVQCADGASALARPRR